MKNHPSKNWASTRNQTASHLASSSTNYWVSSSLEDHYESYMLQPPEADPPTTRRCIEGWGWFWGRDFQFGIGTFGLKGAARAWRHHTSNHVGCAASFVMS